MLARLGCPHPHHYNEVYAEISKKKKKKKNEADAKVRRGKGPKLIN